MTLDTWTIAALAHELRQTIAGGRVQQVLQTDEVSLALEVYAHSARHYLLLSAHQQAPRVHLMQDKPRRGSNVASPLLELMRKFLRGAGLVAVSQPPWERILHLGFEHPQQGPALLIMELIGRRANLILLRPSALHEGDQAARILDCLHRIKPRSPEGRTVLPGRPYQPPPTQDGWPPDQLTELRLRLMLQAAEPGAPLWRALVKGLLGISPQLAREIAFRATGDAQQPVAQVAQLQPILEVLEGFSNQLSNGPWQPGLLVDASADPTPLGFSSYQLQHRLVAGRMIWQGMDSMSLAVQSYFEHALDTAGDPYAAARSQLARRIDQSREKLQRRLDAMARQVRPEHEIENLRVAGEWILALASQIRARQALLPLPEGVELDPIPLDPTLTAAQNAAVYFKRYRKAKGAGEAIAARQADAEAGLAYLDQLATDLELAGDRAEIDAVRAALVEGGYLRLPKGGVVNQPQGPRQFTSREGFAILVGRNSRQNERVTFKLATADDLWLHARGWPGSHVVIRSQGQPVSQDTLTQAAELAAFFSRARSENWVDVIVAERRQVRRAPGGRPGMVMVSGERVLRVQPRLPAPGHRPGESGGLPHAK